MTSLPALLHEHLNLWLEQFAWNDWHKVEVSYCSVEVEKLTVFLYDNFLCATYQAPQL